jgi:RsiW-degrading membrane proteinase PrsW (M82 family)
MLERALSVVLAVAFSGVLIALVMRHFGCWAGRDQIGRGAALSLLSMLLAVILSPLLMASFAPANASSVVSLLFNAFVGAGLAEELARWIVLLLLFKALITNEPSEFLCGAAAVGLGFGVLENILYLTTAKNALALGAIRGVLCAPGHLAYALVSAAGLWSWLRRKGGFLHALLSLTAAIALHGGYDAAAMIWAAANQPDPVFPVSTLALIAVFVALAVLIALQALALLLALDKFRDWTDVCRASGRGDLIRGKSSSYDGVWTAAPTIVTNFAIVSLLAPFALFVLHREDALLHTPVLIGVAVSLQLWSVAIGQLELQRA